MHLGAQNADSGALVTCGAASMLAEVALDSST